MGDDNLGEVIIYGAFICLLLVFFYVMFSKRGKMMSLMSHVGNFVFGLIYMFLYLFLVFATSFAAGFPLLLDFYMAAILPAPRAEAPAARAANRLVFMPVGDVPFDLAQHQLHPFERQLELALHGQNIPDNDTPYRENDVHDTFVQSGIADFYHSKLAHIKRAGGSKYRDIMQILRSKHDLEPYLTNHLPISSLKSTESGILRKIVQYIADVEDPELKNTLIDNLLLKLGEISNSITRPCLVGRVTRLIEALYYTEIEKTPIYSRSVIRDIVTNLVLRYRDEYLNTLTTEDREAYASENEQLRERVAEYVRDKTIEECKNMPRMEVVRKEIDDHLNYL